MTTNELRRELFALGFSPELAYAIAEDEAEEDGMDPREHYFDLDSGNDDWTYEN